MNNALCNYKVPLAFILYPIIVLICVACIPRNVNQSGTDYALAIFVCSFMFTAVLTVLIILFIGLLLTPFALTVCWGDRSSFMWLAVVAVSVAIWYMNGFNSSTNTLNLNPSQRMKIDAM